MSIKDIKMKIKQWRCKHEYVPKVWLYDYYDASGVHVYVYRCYCDHCGKIINQKFTHEIEYV